MNRLKQLFANRNSPPAAPDIFAGWPVVAAPVIPRFPQIFGNDLIAEVINVGSVSPTKLTPAIIVALGQAGRLAVKELLKQPGVLPGIKNGSLSIVGLLKAGDNATGLDENIRSLNVQPTGTSLDRQAYAAGFRVSDFNAWLSNYPHSYREKKPHVFLLASLHDPLIGILPRILQMIVLQPWISKTFAMIAVDLPEGEFRLPDESAAGALRELTRFLRRDDHIIPGARGVINAEAVPERELLHHLFLVSRPDLNDGHHGSYTDTVNQIIVESTYTLLHPSGMHIHLRLSNARTKAAGLVSTLGMPVLSSCSVVTLDVPWMELQEYIASRVVDEILFESGSGLFGDREKIWDPQMSEGHQVFGWLLGLRENINSFKPPRLEGIENFRAAFRAMMSNSLNGYLNAGGTLQGAQEGLKRTSTDLSTALSFVSSANTGDWAPVTELIKGMQADITKVKNAVEAWERVLFGTGSSPVTASHLDNPFDLGRPSKNGEAGPSLKEKSNNLRQESLARLMEICSRRQYLYSVLADREQVEEFYNRAVTRGQVDKIIESVRKRQGWWLKWEKSDLILSMIFLPDGWQPEQEQGKACFGMNQVIDMYQAVLNLAGSETGDIHNRFSPEYFDRLMLKGLHKLGEADNMPALQYVEDLALPYQNIQDCRLGFVFGRDSTQLIYIGGEGPVFRSLAMQDADEFPGNESTRVTAFGLYNFMPLEAVKLFSSRRNTATYIFPEEFHADIYENLMSAREQELLTPELVCTLNNSNLVHLFFGLLFAGMININVLQPVNYGQAAGCWHIDGINDIPSYPLSSLGSITGLWEAYRNFVLRFPVDPRRVPIEINNPVNPFLPARRVNYFNDLHGKYSELQQSGVQVDERIIDGWQRELKQSNDRLLVQFSLIMKIERQNRFRPLKNFSEPLFGNGELI